MLNETLRRQHRHPPGVDILLGGHAFDSPEVVDMTMGVDHPGHGPVPTMLAIQSESGRSSLSRYQRINDDNSGIALHEADVRQIHPPHLIQPRNDLEQAIGGDQHRLPPQTRVHRLRGITLNEAIAVVVPHHGPVISGHSVRLTTPETTARRIVEVTRIRKRQAVQDRPLLPGDRVTRVMRRSSHDSTLLPPPPARHHPPGVRTLERHLSGPARLELNHPQLRNVAVNVTFGRLAWCCNGPAVKNLVSPAL
nr:hypothetical protein [Jatrophihabitans sp. GAS493]